MRRRRPVVLLGLLLATAALASLSLPTQVKAADPPAQLTVDVQDRGDGYWTLSATLTRGRDVQTGQTVDFYQVLDFFGERRVPLGSAVTDAAGVASRAYSPTSNGRQEILARYSAEEGTVESDLFEITVSGAEPVIPEQGPVLPIIQAWAFPVGAAVLALVWLMLGLIFFRAVLGIRRRAGADLPEAAPVRDGRMEPVPQETNSTE